MKVISNNYPGKIDNRGGIIFKLELHFYLDLSKTERDERLYLRDEPYLGGKCI